MSPKKPPKTSLKKATKTLTIDFAGISTLVWNRKAGTAEVRLVDLASAGFQRHYAALGLKVTETTPKAVRGPEADAAVSLPDANEDLGLWNLLGCDVEIVGAAGKLTVDDSKVDLSKKPGKNEQSVRWLANIGYLASSATPNPICPTAATVRIPAGHLTANATVGARKVEFSENGMPVGPDRYCVPRLRATIPFETELAIVLDRQRVLRFGASMSVVISNTCVCAVGMPGMPNHFYAHYDVVDARRRPTVAPAGVQPMTPSWPEFCYMGYVEI